jgi:hypothetical protein
MARVPALLALVLVLPACHGVELASEARDSIRIVCVAPEIAMPEKLDMFDYQITSTGLLTFPIASAIGKNRADEMVGTMARGEISLAEIVRSEFESALSRSGLFQLGAPGESQATFQLEVFAAGMSRPSAFSLDTTPDLGVEASLVDASGTLLWQQRGYTGGLDKEDKERPAYLYETYSREPEKVREAFTVAARLTAEKLIESLREKPPMTRKQRSALKDRPPARSR